MKIYIVVENHRDREIQCAFISKALAEKYIVQNKDDVGRSKYYIIDTEIEDAEESLGRLSLPAKPLC